MHNIPALLLGLTVLLAWKRELIGGIVFTVAGLLYILMLAINQTFEWYMLSWSLIIAGPALVTGLLFFKNWQDKQKKHISPKSNAKTPRINILKRKKR